MGNWPGAKIPANRKENGNGLRREMVEKWPSKWKNGPENGIWPDFGHFSISAAIFRPFQA